MASVTALHPSVVRQSSIPVNQEPHGSLPQVGKSTTHSTIPNGTVNATLNFFAMPQDGSKPFNYVEKPPEGQPQRNFPDANNTVTINDIRGRETNFSLDKSAFLATGGYPHNPEIDWYDDDNIKRIYYPEVERVLKENTSAYRVLLFDHTIRRAIPGATRAPVIKAHIDQTPKSAKQRVEFHLPDEADQLLKGRYRIINVWRPLNGPVESHPLAFADSATVPDDDMVGIEHRYPDRTGETAGVKYNPDHAWYYWSSMENDERLLLQCFDSANPGTRLPHSAFVDSRNDEHSKPRESIEVRALVFG